MSNWIFYKLEYAVYLILGVWYLFQTPIFSSLQSRIFANLPRISRIWKLQNREEINPSQPPFYKGRKKSELLPSDAVPSFHKGGIGWISKIPLNPPFIKGENNFLSFDLVRYGKILVIMALAIKLIKAVVFSILQYFAFWEKLKPPFTTFSYSLGYNFTHFWLTPLLAILLAFLAFWFIRFINKKCQERFFYEEEYYFAAFGMLAVSGMRNIDWFWPILYFSAVLFMGLLVHFIKLGWQRLSYLFLSKTENSAPPTDAQSPRQSASSLRKSAECASEASAFKFSFYYIWLPLAICGTIIMLISK